MFRVSRSFRSLTFTRYAIPAPAIRGYTTAQATAPTAAGATDDLRSRLTRELKAAMKDKDTVKSTTIRSVLSEIYAADKTRPQPLTSPEIVPILLKASKRRTTAAQEFTKASRPDLASAEIREATLLSAFLPALLSESEIDHHLHAVLADQKPDSDPRKALGRVLKEFYTRVDRTRVDPDVVKQRAEALLSAPLQ